MATSSSSPVLTLRALARDVVWPIITFPFWWYGAGLVTAARFVVRELIVWGQRLSLRLLGRNLFKPMYGDYTKTGRAISLVLRLLIFVVRLVAFALWLVVLAFMFAAYLTFPMLTAWFFIRSLMSA